jgi:hypothetical protein
LNNVETSEQVSAKYKITNSLSFVSVTEKTGGATLSITNNTTEEVRYGNIKVEIVPDSTETYPLQSAVPSATLITVNQTPGQKVYSEVTASLSYPDVAPAHGGYCNPTVTYSQTYT